MADPLFSDGSAGTVASVVGLCRQQNTAPTGPPARNEGRREMHSLLSAWRQTSRRAKVALIVAPVLCLVAASSAAAYSGFFAPNPLNPSEQDATKIVGIQQLVAT